MLGLIVVFSLIGGLLSLSGGALLLTRKKISPEMMLVMISFAAGVLLSVAFGDLLPEAVESALDMAVGAEVVLYWALAAVVGFFLFERSFVWWHHHHGPHEDQPDPVIAMVWLGDTLHNFLDGVVIATSFLVSVPLGIATSLAVAAHELPQEIADFSLFLSKGVAKAKVLVLNVTSSLATTLAAILTFFFWETIYKWQPQLLGFTAGMFIYIACSDLIPELHSKHKKARVWLHTLAFMLGVGLTLGLKGALK